MGNQNLKLSNKIMVDRLVEENRYIKSAQVEGAFRAVDRAMYFDMAEGESTDPYKDDPWRRDNLHLSAPCIYANALEALQLKSGLSFLNLGSGTGYLNTLAGLLIGPHGLNHGIEYHRDVVEYANKRLLQFKQQSYAIDKYDFAEPTFIVGNCVNLSPSTKRYDRIYLGAACLPELEQFMKNLIKPEGGILVMPFENHLMRYVRLTETEWRSDKLMDVNFTNMIGTNGSGAGGGVEAEQQGQVIIEMPLASFKSLKELCRIAIRQQLRAKINQSKPNLLHYDNIKSRRSRQRKRQRLVQLAVDRRAGKSGRQSKSPFGKPKVCELGAQPANAASSEFAKNKKAADTKQPAAAAAARRCKSSCTASSLARASRHRSRGRSCWCRPIDFNSPLRYNPNQGQSEQQQPPGVLTRSASRQLSFRCNEPSSRSGAAGSSASESANCDTNEQQRRQHQQPAGQREPSSSGNSNNNELGDSDRDGQNGEPPDSGSGSGANSVQEGALAAGGGATSNTSGNNCARTRPYFRSLRPDMAAFRMQALMHERRPVNQFNNRSLVRRIDDQSVLFQVQRQLARFMHMQANEAQNLSAPSSADQSSSESQSGSDNSESDEASCHSESDSESDYSEVSDQYDDDDDDDDDDGDDDDQHLDFHFNDVEPRICNEHRQWHLLNELIYQVNVLNEDEIEIGHDDDDNDNDDDNNDDDDIDDDDDEDLDEEDDEDILSESNDEEDESEGLNEELDGEDSDESHREETASKPEAALASQTRKLERKRKRHSSSDCSEVSQTSSPIMTCRPPKADKSTDLQAAGSSGSSLQAGARLSWCRRSQRHCPTPSASSSSIYSGSASCSAPLSSGPSSSSPSIQGAAGTDAATTPVVVAATTTASATTAAATLAAAAAASTLASVGPSGVARAPARPSGSASSLSGLSDCRGELACCGLASKSSKPSLRCGQPGQRPPRPSPSSASCASGASSNKRSPTCKRHRDHNLLSGQRGHLGQAQVQAPGSGSSTSATSSGLFACSSSNANASCVANHCGCPKRETSDRRQRRCQSSRCRNKRKQRQNRRRERNHKDECQKYHKQLSSSIKRLAIPLVLRNYLNFDR